MEFEVCTGLQSGYSIKLLNNGKVAYATWQFEGSTSSCPDDEPSDGMCGDHNPYGSFVNTLERVAKRYPEVYRAVYEHIQSRTEDAYVRLAKYCKSRNNQYISQFQIIE